MNTYYMKLKQEGGEKWEQYKAKKKAARKLWRKNNPDKLAAQKKRHKRRDRKRNPEKYKRWRKQWLATESGKKWQKRDAEREKIRHPYINSYKGAKSRCNNPNDEAYRRYGGRGIKFLLTLADMRTLWDRDRASEMARPSLDRIDNNGHYELSNCRFVELWYNGIKGQGSDLDAVYRYKEMVERAIEEGDREREERLKGERYNKLHPFTYQPGDPEYKP